MSDQRRQRRRRRRDRARKRVRHARQEEVRELLGSCAWAVRYRLRHANTRQTLTRLRRRHARN